MLVKKIKEHIIWIGLLTIFVFTAYHNSFSGEFISDDFGLLVLDKQVGEVKNIFSSTTVIPNFVRFITYRLFGFQQYYYHLINVLIHLANVILVYFLICLSSRNNKKQLAFFTAGLFAVHPLMTESVTWISGLAYPLYAFFILTSFIFFIISDHRKSITLYFFSLLFFVFSLLTQPKAVVYPLIILIYNLLFQKNRKRFLNVLPYIILVIAGSFFLVFPYLSLRIKEAYLLGTKYVSGFDLSAPFISLATYLKLFIWPMNLSLYHSEPINNFTYLFSAIVIILLIFTSFYFWKRNKELFFWLLFFITSLVFSLTPFPIASFVAERYVYLGSVGIFYIFSYFVAALGKKINSFLFPWIIISILIIVLSIRTIKRNDDWKTLRSFWTTTVQTSPFSYQAHNNYGILLLNEGKIKQASQEFQKTIYLKKDYALAHHNLGYTYQLSGKHKEAIKEYTTAIQLDSNTWRSYVNLGGIHMQLKQYDLAVKYMKKAIEINPENPAFYENLGIVYIYQGDYTKAGKVFATALKLNPKSTKAAYGLRLVDSKIKTR